MHNYFIMPVKSSFFWNIYAIKLWDVGSVRGLRFLGGLRLLVQRAGKSAGALHAVLLQAFCDDRRRCRPVCERESKSKGAKEGNPDGLRFQHAIPPDRTNSTKRLHFRRIGKKFTQLRVGSSRKVGIWKLFLRFLGFWRCGRCRLQLKSTRN